MISKSENASNPAPSANTPNIPSNLPQYVANTAIGLVRGCSPETRDAVETILSEFREFLLRDEITESRSFTALYKLLRYGIEFNERRQAQEKQNLQQCVNRCPRYSVSELRELVKEQKRQAPPGESDIMDLVAEFNEAMLKEFNEKFTTNKERLFAYTVNFVSEQGFSKILESIYFASPQQTHELAYMFLKKVFKNTYDVVQKMDRKQILYPCIFKEPLRKQDQENEQAPPTDPVGRYALCYDFDIGNLYSYLDLLSNALRKMLNRNYITEKYKYYTEEKKKNQEEGYISYPLLLSLILRFESKESVINNMIVQGQGEKDELKSVLFEFIKMLQTSEFLFLYSLKRYQYLKHFVLELLQDKQLAGIPQFYAGMVIAIALLSNEQYQPPYPLIEKLMDEKASLQKNTKTELAASLNELAPKTLDNLMRFIVKGSYLLGGEKAKRILEEKFEEAKIMSAVQDPLSAIMQGISEIGLEEAQAIVEKNMASPQERNAKILESAQVEKKFSIWQNLIKQIFQWRVKNIPEPLKWVEDTANALDKNKNRHIEKEVDTKTLKRLRGLQPVKLNDGFSFFPAKISRWQEKVVFIERFHRRRGVCLGIETKFKETLRDLIEAFFKQKVVYEAIHDLEKGGTFHEYSLMIRLPRDDYYKLPGQHKRKIQLFLGIGLIPMKKPNGPIASQPCLFLFQEIPSGFHGKGFHPIETSAIHPETGQTKAYELLEITLSESYYLTALLGLLDTLRKWLPSVDWDKESAQKVIGSILDYQTLASSSNEYGAVGGEVLLNPNWHKGM